jgi:nitrate reductase gamma subunit
LIFFLVTFAVLIVGLELQPPGAGLRTVVRGLLTFQTGTPMGGVFAAGVVMASALAAYIPFTHMSHFIAKYFTYHEVRWDDRVNRRGGDIEAKLLPYFGYRPTWAAAHMHADGKKTWAEIVAINPAAEVKK